MLPENARTSGRPRFLLGRIVITRNALNVLPNPDVLAALKRHAAGDWGMLDAEDIEANEQSLRSGGRLFSRYVSTGQVPFWIITEWDRSATTILLPEDY